MTLVPYYLRNTEHSTPCIEAASTYNMNLSAGSGGTFVEAPIPSTLFSILFVWEVDVVNVKNGYVDVLIDFGIQNYVQYEAYVTLLEDCDPFLQIFTFSATSGYLGPIFLDWGGKSGGTVRVVVLARKTVGSMSLDGGVFTGPDSYIEIDFIDGDVAEGGVVCGGEAVDTMGVAPGYGDFDIHLRNPEANTFDIYFDELLPVIWYKTTPQGNPTLFDNIGDADGTLTNYPEGTISPWGALDDRYCLEFDPPEEFYEPGANGTHVSIPYTSVWDWPDGFTIMLWYRPKTLTISDLGETNAVLFNYGGTETDNFISLVNPDLDNIFGYPHFSIWDDNEGSTFSVQSPNPSVVGVWQHIACVARNGFMGIYHNGELVDSTTDLTTPIDTTTGNRYLGILSTSNFKSYIGYMSDIRVYNTPLSATQIETIYEQEALQRSRLSPFDPLGDI